MLSEGASSRHTLARRSWLGYQDVFQVKLEYFDLLCILTDLHEGPDKDGPLCQPDYIV